MVRKAHVIGNVTVDQTLSVAALPAPGASVLGRMLSEDPGGKGLNQAVVLARCGLACALTGVVGRDARAALLAERLAGEPLERRFLVREEVATDLSLILVEDGAENVVVTTDAAAARVTPADAEAALTEASSGDLLLLQGNLSAETTAAALRRAREMGVTTCVNPSPLRPYFGDLLPLVDLAFVNAGEAEALGGVAGMRASGVMRVVRTLGADGAELHGPEGVIRAPAEPVAAVDPTGAGDCFMAVCLASAALRDTVPDARALRHGASAAAHTVARPGTLAAFPEADRLAALLRTE